jgi:hypothetical protein
VIIGTADRASFSRRDLLADGDAGELVEAVRALGVTGLAQVLALEAAAAALLPQSAASAMSSA